MLLNQCNDFCFLLSFNRLPMNFCWDNDDARFLACQTRRVPQAAEKRAPPTSMSTMRRASEVTKSPNHSLASIQDYATDSQVMILFVKNGSNLEIKQMEHTNLVVSEELVNLCAPYLVPIPQWFSIICPTQVPLI